MAWQKPGVWKSPLPNQPKDDSSFPGLKTGPEAANKIEYEELQQNELLALAAIYGDDFVQHTAPHSAWQVSCLAHRLTILPGDVLTAH